MRLRFNSLLAAALGLIVTARAAPLAFELRPVFNGRPLGMDSLRYETAADETVSFSRLGLLLSDFALETDRGEWIELDAGTVFLDASKRRLDARLGEMPEGRYRSIRFAVGPAPEINHADPAGRASDDPLNPVLNNLHWDWRTGYVFMALEGRYRIASETISGFVLHLGNDWNRTWVHLPARIDGSSPSLLTARLDLAALLNTPTPISFAQAGNITHSRENDPLAAALRDNLPTAFSIDRVLAVESKTAETEPVQPLYLPERFTPYPLSINPTFPLPELPLDNPLTVERVELGERLFHDELLSADLTLSCASCHDAERAFTDGRALSTGVGGRSGTRNAMPLFNLAWKQRFFWDGRAPSLREQVLEPITHPAELANDLDTVLERLNHHPEYPVLFADAFQPAKPTAEKIALALEAYLLTLVSGDSRFDQARAGAAELSPEERRGMELFFTEYDPRTRQFGADCFHCHGGALFTDHGFHNNGLAERDDLGRFEITRDPADRLAFSTPSLRNIELTAPYMHDGRLATLEEVIEHYASPMPPSDALDPNLAKHPQTGIQLSDSDQAALVAFLKTLTDEN